MSTFLMGGSLIGVFRQATNSSIPHLRDGLNRRRQSPYDLIKPFHQDCPRGEKQNMKRLFNKGDANRKRLVNELTKIISELKEKPRET